MAARWRDMAGILWRAYYGHSVYINARFPRRWLDYSLLNLHRISHLLLSLYSLPPKANGEGPFPGVVDISGILLTSKSTTLPSPFTKFLKDNPNKDGNTFRLGTGNDQSNQ